MPEIAYRLSLAPALEPYRAEIEYALDFVDASHFVRRVTGGAARTLHYGADAPAGSVAVPAVLFPAGVRCDSSGIHPVLDAIRRIFPQSHDTPYDAIGVIFLMLSRLEERGSAAVDRYGRFPHAAALPVADADGAPLADRAAFDLARLLTGEDRPANRTAYQALLTHDVDRLRGYHYPLEPLRYAAGDALKRGRPDRALQRLRDGYLSGEPWRSSRWLMDISERKGVQSRFYFQGPSRSSMDSPYAITMQPLLRDMVGEIKRRGHVVGFHPNFGTATDGATWRRMKEGLETTLGLDVREGRQHVLCWRADETPDIWDDNGMEADLTLAWPELTGFRNGTCRPFHAYSLRQRRALRVKHQATAVQDFGLFGGKYRDLSLGQALDEARTAAATCRRFGGTFAVLQHTGPFDNLSGRFYERVVHDIA